VSSRAALIETAQACQRTSDQASPASLLRAVCEFDEWHVPGASRADFYEGEQTEGNWQVAMLHTAAGDDEVFIFSSHDAYAAFRAMVPPAVEFGSEVMPGCVALHPSLIQYEENDTLRRVRIDHGEDHSFIFERTSFELLSQWTQTVMVERTLAALHAAEDPHSLPDKWREMPFTAEPQALLDFDFHVLHTDEEGAQLLPLAAVTGDAADSHLAVVFTAPDYVERFAVRNAATAKVGMKVGQMKGRAVFELAQHESTCAATSAIAFNPGAFHDDAGDDAATFLLTSAALHPAQERGPPSRSRRRK